MKKLWVMALGTAFLLQTALLYAADIKFEGDFRVRGIYADDLDANEDVDDQQAFADGRFRFRTTATAGITSGVVTLDFTSSYMDPRQTGAGVDCSVTSCTTGNYRFGSANLGGSYNIVGVREAYLKLDLNMVKLAFGRKPFRLGHSLILDDTMDAIVGKFMVGGFEVMLANGKLLDTNNTGLTGSTSPIGGTGSDTDIYLAKTGFTHGDMHNIGVFAGYLNDRGPSFLPAGAGVPDKTDLWILGVTADGKFGAINLGAEVNFLTGSQDTTGADSVDLAGMNVLIGVGVDIAAVDVGVTALYTTGQEEVADEINVNGISGNFVLGNILVNDTINSDREGQCASTLGSRIGSGARGCVGGFGIMALKISAGLEGVPFGKTCHTELAAIWAQTTEDPVVGGTTGDSDLGIEIDLNHKHKLDDNVGIGVKIGYLLSGDAWQTIGGGDDNQLKAIASIDYMF